MLIDDATPAGKRARGSLANTLTCTGPSLLDRPVGCQQAGGLHIRRGIPSAPADKSGRAGAEPGLQPLQRPEQVYFIRPGIRGQTKDGGSRPISPVFTSPTLVRLFRSWPFFIGIPSAQLQHFLLHEPASPGNCRHSMLPAPVRQAREASSRCQSRGMNSLYDRLDGRL